MLRIGTRGSQLALAQAEETKARLIAAHPELDGQVDLVIIKTTGDKVLDRALSEVGGKGLFTKEIEEALLDGSIDLAVHSMKDMPTVLPEGLEISCLLPREDTRDAFISPKAKCIDDLPEGAVVGSASLRRQSQILHKRPDLKVVTYRGNVQSRLKKLADGVVDATLLAMAGLNRLGLTEDVVTDVIDHDTMLPAVAQGAVGIETRIGDEAVLKYLAPLNCTETEVQLAAERAFLAELDGSCRTPIAGLAVLDGDKVLFRGQVLTPDGVQSFEVTKTGTRDEAAIIGRAAALEIKEMAGKDVFTWMQG